MTSKWRNTVQFSVSYETIDANTVTLNIFTSILWRNTILYKWIDSFSKCLLFWCWSCYFVVDHWLQKVHPLIISLVFSINQIFFDGTCNTFNPFGKLCALNKKEPLQNISQTSVNVSLMVETSTQNRNGTIRNVKNECKSQ